MDLFFYILIHGFIFASIITGYLLLIMIIFPARVWGMEDYPKTITEKVPPQTKEEKKKKTLLFLPFLIVGIVYPVITTLILKEEMGGEIDLLIAFLNIFGIMMFGNAADLLILDILIVGTITPRFVILPGTEDLKRTEYRAFRKYHAKGHIWGTILMAGLSLLIAFLISVF